MCNNICNKIKYDLCENINLRIYIKKNRKLIDKLLLDSNHKYICVWYTISDKINQRYSYDRLISSLFVKDKLQKVILSDMSSFFHLIIHF